jgi:hypothetical protein
MGGSGVALLLFRDFCISFFVLPEAIREIHYWAKRRRRRTKKNLLT